MTAVYLILGLPGAGRHELVANLVEDGLEEPRAAAVFYATDDPAPPGLKQNSTLVSYAFRDGRFVIEAKDEPAEELKEVFFITDGRQLVIDQIEAFPAWLQGRGWELARILLVVDCALAAQHPEVAEWHEACVHFADCVLLNRRNAATHTWAQQFQKKFADARYPCVFVPVKQGRVDNALLVLYPEARRLSLAFDSIDPVYELDLDEENLPEEPFTLENKLDPYFERLPSGQRRKAVPDVTAYLTR